MPATTMRRERTFRSARMRRTDVQSNEWETSSPTRFLAGCIIDTLESSFRKRQDLGMPGHPAPNCGLADLDAELEQFSLDAGRAPQRVGLAHAADQSTDFCADLGSPRTA